MGEVNHFQACQSFFLLQVHTRVLKQRKKEKTHSQCISQESGKKQNKVWKQDGVGRFHVKTPEEKQDEEVVPAKE